MSFSNIRRVVALKTHICSECDCEIKIGEQYENAIGVDEDNEFFYAKTCLDCVLDRKYIEPKYYFGYFE